MINRTYAYNEVFFLMKQFPAVAMVGARQVGKTTLALEVAEKLGKKAVFYDLEKKSDREKLTDIEKELSLYENNCVIIDEVQTMPEIFSALRPLIDKLRKPGRFLLLGSVSPEIVRGVSESLAGRIGYTELSPINLNEALASKKSINQLWFRGGYPEALTLKSHMAWYLWAENYFKTFIQRDVNFLMGETLSPSLVNNLWQILSSYNGNILNHESLAKALGITRPTILKYLDFLEHSFIIFRIQPWFFNATKRIVKSPKIYFRDTGVLHYMNRINSPKELSNHAIAGNSWEGFVIEQIKQLKHRTLNVYYYRTHHGAEADMVLVKGSVPLACIEIKKSATPNMTKGWYAVTSDLKTKHNFVITGGDDDRTFGKNFKMCGLEIFLNKYLPKIK